MKRADIWTAAGGSGYAGKPRPVVILQDERLLVTTSASVCGFTTDPVDAPAFRPMIQPTKTNGLRLPCRIMVDKILTLPRTQLGRRLGQLDESDVRALDRAIMIFLGLAD